MEKGPNQKFCAHCGELIDIKAEICPVCGVHVMAPSSYGNSADFIDLHRRWIISILLCAFLGSIGVHRFYNGKIGTGILMILTAGGFGIWYIIDLIMIIMGVFRDKDGNLIR